MVDFEPRPVVALLKDRPDKVRVHGQVGTVVETLAPKVYEVEFSDDSGGPDAAVALRASQLIRLHHEPRPQAA